MKYYFTGILAFFAVLNAITLSVKPDETVTVESALALSNRATYDQYNDSLGVGLKRHQGKTAQHEKADAVTDSSEGSCDNLKSAIVYALDHYANLAGHIAQDSTHNGAGDTVTTLPKLITTSATYAQYKNFVDSLRLCQNAHFGRTISTRYNYLGKIWAAAFIAHCAKDTSDASDVHYFPDTLYATVTFDSTNIDSSYAGWNRHKGRFNSHIADTGFHKTYLNADSITSANATSYATLYALVNEAITKYNTHAARDTSSTDSVHFKADTGLITTAAVTVGGGHIAADAKTYTAQTGGHLAYRLPRSWDKTTIQYTGSSVSTGASFYHYGSVDGVNYAFIDSTSVTANGATLKHLNTNYYPYLKIYLNKRTDGTYKIEFGGK